MSTTNKTNVIGYFNPNEYPLQLSLAEHNMVLQLPPKAYVIDRTGRLVNDPVLDRFVGKGKLARASDQKQQVEITLLRPVNDVAPQPAPHQHSVSQAQRFDTKDGRVVAVNPVNTAPQPATPPPQSYNPVKGMTIEQAKQLKLIKPTKPVPEDFGADETTGAPKSGQEIPQIKYATDTVRGRKPAPLPAELAQPATPQQAAIIQGLERAATSNPDDPNLLSQVARTAVAEAQGVPVTPTVFPKPLLTETPGPAKFVPPPPPEQRVPTTVVSTAPEAEASGIVVEEELPGATAETAPETDLQEEARVEAATRVPPPPLVTAPAAEIKCPECGKVVTNPSKLRQHATIKHPDKLAQIMAPYSPASA